MKEEKDSSPKKNQLPYLVARYEKMVADNGNLFFDVEEFEEILDHYMESGHFQTAIGVLACARSQHPAAMDFHFREAELLAITNRPQKALKVLREVESFESANPELYLTKATIYSQLGSSEKAIDLLRTALDFAAEDRDQIFLNMAFEYHNIGAHEQAIKCLKRALNVNPHNEEAVYELAYAFERADDMPSSARYYERFVDAHPYNAPAWFNLGNTYSRLEKHEEALKAYDFATVIKEDFSAAHFNKGNVMSRMGLYHQAIEAYKSTLQHDLFDALTYYYIGDCYEKLMDFDKAGVFYRKATKSDPHMAEAWMGIGLVL
ncbi:MAG: tetratricopeptide repeat protein, partial [Bacteroidota bacterium]